jgi:hypothetical protein
LVDIFNCYQHILTIAKLPTTIDLERKSSENNEIREAMRPESFWEILKDLQLTLDPLCFSYVSLLDPKQMSMGLSTHGASTLSASAGGLM